MSGGAVRHSTDLMFAYQAGALPGSIANAATSGRGRPITRSVLTQIIFEQESRGQNLLPVQFLRRLIRFYGDQMQGFLPPYLEMSMESFSKAQETMRENMSRAFGATTPMAAFEEQAQRNMALFQQALQMWSPFAASMSSTSAKPAAAEDDSDEDDSGNDATLHGACLDSVPTVLQHTSPTRKRGTDGIG